MSAERVIEVARGELGVTEYPPGSNYVKYWNDYDERMQGQPWCVAFLWWCFQKAGEKMAFFAGAKTASCTTLGRWYKAQGATVPITEVQPGDVVLLNFHGGLSAEHCGLVTEVLGFGLVKTIEGNTSPGEEGSQDNGGCVAQKTRTAAQIVQICRPDYKEEPMPKTDYDKHWARKDIDWCMDRGLLTGYPDGTFHPDEPVTRAEMAVIIRRICGEVRNMADFDPVSYMMGQKAGPGGGSSTLSGLTDVDISNPSDGQMLVYNAASGKWENGAGGVLILHEIPVEANDSNTRAIPVPMVRLDKTWQEIYDAGVCFVEYVRSRGDEARKSLMPVVNIMTPIQEISVTAYTVEAFEASNTTLYTYEVKEGGANGYPEREADE